jgi:aminoglycoside N3'-acetyltransferase
MYARPQLTANVRSLGVVPGDVIMVHASVRSVGEVAGGPDEIHLATRTRSPRMALYYAEHIVDIPDKVVARFKVPVLENGARDWRDMAELDTGEAAHANWPDRFFARLVGAHLSVELTTGRRH